MDDLFQFPLIDISDSIHLLITQRGKLGSFDIGCDLRDS